MRKEFSQKIQLVFRWVLFIGLIVPFIFKVMLGEQQYSQNGTQKLMVILINFESFYCPLCLNWIRDFCDTLHSKGQEELALGVLVYRKSATKGKNERFQKIIEKQLKGFLIGNNIKFPIILDKFHVFVGLKSEDIDLVLLDRSRKLLKKYSFPLTKKQLDEIFSN